MTHTFWQRFALTAFILVDGGAAASAATDACTDLQARLDAVSRSGSGNGDAFRMYDAQVQQQRAAVDRATSQARAAGCYGGIFSPKPGPQCPQFITAINTASATLQHLTETRDQYRSDPYALTSQRNDILRLMSINRCGNYAAYTPPGGGGGGFLASLFGGGFFGNGYSGGYGYSSTYRTLCVRASDGYYFPISFSTTPDHFTADAVTCQSMCPGSAVSLYVHHNPGEEVDSMVSLTGQPYSALPSAFKYRTSYDRSSSCGAPIPSSTDQSAGQAFLTPLPGQQAPVTPISIPGANATFLPLLVPIAPAPLVAMPVRRPPTTSEDPETQADRAGQLVPAPMVADPGPTLAGVTSDGRPIRLVGPSYYVAR